MHTAPAAPGGRHGFTCSASRGLSKKVVRITAAEMLSFRCKQGDIKWAVDKLQTNSGMPSMYAGEHTRWLQQLQPASYRA